MSCNPRSRGRRFREPARVTSIAASRIGHIFVTLITGTCLPRGLQKRPQYRRGETFNVSKYCRKARETASGCCLTRHSDATHHFCPVGVHFRSPGCSEPEIAVFRTTKWGTAVPTAARVASKIAQRMLGFWKETKVMRKESFRE